MTSTQSTPSEGTYRIKLVDQSLYIESLPYPNNPGLKLTSLDTSNAKQQWIFKKASETDAWTITSAYNNQGLTYTRNQNTYWGYGYPHPQDSASRTWSVVPQTSEGKSFSKIKLLNDPYSFDSVSPESDAVHFYSDKKNYSDGPKQCYVFEPVSGSGGKPLDVLFLQDFTGSQQAYIDQARAQIEAICVDLRSRGNVAPGDLRFGVVAFRDHKPEDKTFITKALIPGSNPGQAGFTTDPVEVMKVLNSLVATGGGDGPEAQADALQMAVKASWNSRALKLALLITDSPPHGIGEKGDRFPNGVPTQIEPLRMAMALARLGVTLYVIACEPTLSGYYDHARGFYEALAQITGGRVLDLGSVISLSQFISGAAVETIDHEALVSQYSETVRSLVAQNSNASNAEIAKKLYAQLEKQDVKMRTLNFSEIIVDESVRKAAQVWFEVDTLAEGRKRIQNIEPSQLQDYYAVGLPQSEPTLSDQSISLSQVEGIVQKCRMRNN